MTQLHSCSPEKGKERICKSYHSPTNFILATDTSPIKSNYTKGAFLWSDLDRDKELKVALRRKFRWERKVLSKIYTVNLTNHVIIMYQSIPAVPMHPPPLANPWALAFFLKKMDKYPEVGTHKLSKCPRVGTKNEGKYPALGIVSFQHFSRFYTVNKTVNC